MGKGWKPWVDEGPPPNEGVLGQTAATCAGLVGPKSDEREQMLAALSGTR